MYRTSVHVRSDLGSTEPVEDGVAVQRGTHQSFLNGDELLKIGQAGRLPDSPHQSCKATARKSVAILDLPLIEWVTHQFRRDAFFLMARLLAE
jgi:hypothetical protein